ncbi:hypothetical protein MNBD_ALPHA01-103 [hydrothermal vent metagenome]|uniref:Uncharacterized protein n=1 Tax=hydrothermal vent metagenome TaxID=652676 RepID=A0A3B0RCM3_9ZZZZ
MRFAGGLLIETLLATWRPLIFMRGAIFLLPSHFSLERTEKFYSDGKQKQKDSNGKL